ncbi:MAG: class II glutamine amidotransferase, partial [Burkholderiales bacterium]|nr:class II glutamine amidotransferase [Burkholderiales bacterium]
VDFSAVTTPADCVAVIATMPLTDNEAWTAMQAGELLIFRDGRPVSATRLAIPEHEPLRQAA